MSSLAALFLIFITSQSSAEDIVSAIKAEEQARLEACLTKIDDSPEEAYEDGLAWVAEGSRPPARHCRALALVALEQYEVGAAQLEALAAAPDAGSLDQRALYLSQASSAWLQAGAFEAAIVTLSEALRLRPNETNFLVDRALARIALRHYLEARDDLNTALAQEPSNSDALQLRAEVNLQEDRLNDALDDIESALLIDPVNVDVALKRGEIREAIRLENER